MKFTLFASTYSSITNPYSDLIGDRALDLDGTSSTCEFDVSSLDKAIQLFHSSETYFDFCEKHLGRVYTYLCLEDGRVENVD